MRIFADEALIADDGALVDLNTAADHTCDRIHGETPSPR